jgi:hypothetical protein
MISFPILSSRRDGRKYWQILSEKRLKLRRNGEKLPYAFHAF